MPMKLKELETEARKLSDQERAVLAHRLLESIEPEPNAQIEQLWIAEAERRIQEIKDGKVKCEDADQVFAEIRAELNEKS